MNLKKTFLLALLLVVFVACEKNQSSVSEEPLTELKAASPIFMDLGNTVQRISAKSIKGLKGESNKAKSYNVALYSAEYLTAGDSEDMGNIIYFMNVGNKQLGGDFAPGLALDGTDNVSYYVDDNRPSQDLDVAVTNDAIDRAMATWDGVTCSDLGMYEVPYDGRSTGFIAALLGMGGSFDYTADVVHCGWDEDLVAAIYGPGNSVLGVTFTIIFTDNDGNPVDTDNNGKYDVAYREIYYNDAYPWNDGAHYDVETIALHEAGHGLSQGHFGKAFASGNFEKGTAKLHFAPRAVMNAAYSGIQTGIEETDNAGHCSNWAQWPMN